MTDLISPAAPRTKPIIFETPAPGFRLLPSFLSQDPVRGLLTRGALFCPGAIVVQWLRNPSRLDSAPFISSRYLISEADSFSMVPYDRGVQFLNAPCKPTRTLQERSRAANSSGREESSSGMWYDPSSLFSSNFPFSFPHG